MPKSLCRKEYEDDRVYNKDKYGLVLDKISIALDTFDSICFIWYAKKAYD